MSVTSLVLLYLISVPIFFVVDLLWLGVIAKSFYRSRLGHLMGDINWPAAIIFYLIFLIGLTYFATYPAVLQGILGSAFMLGALYGFFTYATYDLTNLATLRDWPIVVVVVDIVWGTILGSVVSGITFLSFTSVIG
jgi:uncharacterized membrane protein